MKFMIILYGFLTNLAVIVGGLTVIAWFGGSLVLYALLDRPLWEVVIVIGASLFVFTRFCAWVVRRRPAGGSWRYYWLDEDSESYEQIRELEGFIDEIEEEMSEARREDNEEEHERLEEIKLDYLSQIEGCRLDNDLVGLRRLRKEARKAGRKDEAEAYSKRIKKHEARLRKEGDRLEYLPWYAKIIAYGMIGGIMYTVAFLIWAIPGALLVQTWGFWVGWTAGDGWMNPPGWMNSPEVMIAVVPGCLALACAGVWIVSWHFSPAEPEAGKEKKKKNTGKKRGAKAAKDSRDSSEETGTDPSPPPPPPPAGDSPPDSPTSA